MRNQLYKSPAHVKSHTNDSGSFFGALGFTVPVNELTLRTAAKADVLDWLTMPKGPYLVDAGPIETSRTALAIMVTPEALYDPNSPRVGLGLVYKAPYIRAASFSKAYFFLMSTSRTEVANRITDALVMFVQVHESSEVIPLPGVPTLFLDVVSPDDITASKEARSPQVYRGFWLHKVSYVGQDRPVTQVAFP